MWLLLMLVFGATTLGKVDLWLGESSISSPVGVLTVHWRADEAQKDEISEAKADARRFWGFDTATPRHLLFYYQKGICRRHD